MGCNIRTENKIHVQSGKASLAPNAVDSLSQAQGKQDDLVTLNRVATAIRGFMDLEATLCIGLDTTLDILSNTIAGD